MRKTQILNCVLLLLVAAMAVYIVLSSRNQTSAPQTATAQTDSATAGGEWKEIKPEELKNPVALFSADWMALAAGKKGDLNAMTVGWGTIGVLWGKPVVTVYVRKSRYTNELMKRNEYFTLTAFPENHRSALEYLGSHSGRNEKDKLKKAGLTTEFTALGNPLFKEANLAVECRVLFKETMKKELILDKDIETKLYEGDEKSEHVMYVGEIVHVWKK